MAVIWEDAGLADLVSAMCSRDSRATASTSIMQTSPFTWLNPLFSSYLNTTQKHDHNYLNQSLFKISLHQENCSSSAAQHVGTRSFFFPLQLSPNILSGMFVCYETNMLSGSSEPVLHGGHCCSSLGCWLQCPNSQLSFQMASFRVIKPVVPITIRKYWLGLKR